MFAVGRKVRFLLLRLNILAFCETQNILQRQTTSELQIHPTFLQLSGIIAGAKGPKRPGKSEKSYAKEIQADVAVGRLQER